MAQTSSMKVPAGTLSKLFGVSEHQLGRLAVAGHVIRAGPGHYDLWLSVRGYIAYLQKRLESGRKAPQAHTLNLTQAKIAETQGRAERIALRNAEVRGELVTVQLIIRTFGNLFTSMRERILASDLTTEEKDQLLGDLRGLLEAEALLHEQGAAHNGGNGSSPAGPGGSSPATPEDDLS